VTRRPGILDQARATVAAQHGRSHVPVPTQVSASPPVAAELIVTPLNQKKVRPVKYLVPGRIPLGKLILIAAAGGKGKSTLMRSVTADISMGRCALGLVYADPIRAKVLIVAAEDGPEDTILPGLLAEGADVSRVSILEGVRRGSSKTDFTLAPEHVELVRRRLQQTPEIKLVIIDPIASFVGRSKVDDHRATELRLVLDPLSEIAEHTGVTVVMIAHLNKSTGDAVDRIAGSAAYRDAVRAAYLVCVDPEDESRRLLMPVKENLPGFERTTIPFMQVPLNEAEAAVVLGREQFRELGEDDRRAIRNQLRRVRFEVAMTVDPDATLKAKKADGTKVQKCKDWLKQFLAMYAYPSDEILAAAKSNGFTFDNLKEAKAELKRDGVIYHSNSQFPGGWWSGPGIPAGWTARPGIPDQPAPHTPHSSPHSSLSSLPPDRETGETGERGEWGGDKRTPPDGSRTVTDKTAQRPQQPAVGDGGEL